MDLEKTKMVVEKLEKDKKTLSTMESCTGGSIANCITNVDGSSSIFKFGAITYSNDFKIKMGIDENTINEFTVYSMEVAKEMSKSICKFSGSDYGIGVTGKLNCEDEENPKGDKNKVYFSIYDEHKNKYYNKCIKVNFKDRQSNKNLVVEEIMSLLLNSVL